MKRLDTEPNFLMDFSKIRPNENGTGICYVTNGIHRVSQKTGRAHITLFLQDIHGTVVQGYVYHVEDLFASGLELTKVVHNLVQIDWMENYFDPVGLTFNIRKISIVNDASPEDRAIFVGDVSDKENRIESLRKLFSSVLHTESSLPYSLRTQSSGDYNNGKIGGLLLHYHRMSIVLQNYVHSLSAREYEALISLFMLYIAGHSAFVKSNDEGSADINCFQKLQKAIHELSKKLPVSEGAMELIPALFGTPPTDIFVVLLLNTSQYIQSSNQLISVYKSLPLSRTACIGDQKLRRYADEYPK